VQKTAKPGGMVIGGSRPGLPADEPKPRAGPIALRIQPRRKRLYGLTPRHRESRERVGA